MQVDTSGTNIYIYMYNIYTAYYDGINKNEEIGVRG